MNNLYKSLTLLVDTDRKSAEKLRQLAMRNWDSAKVGTDRKDRQPYASVLESAQDSKIPTSDGRSVINSFSYTSNYRFSQSK